MIAPLTLQEVHEATQAGWARHLHTSASSAERELDEALARASELQWCIAECAWPVGGIAPISAGNHAIAIAFAAAAVGSAKVVMFAAT